MTDRVTGRPSRRNNDDDGDQASRQSRPGRGVEDRHRLRAVARGAESSSPSIRRPASPFGYSAAVEALESERADFALGNRFLGSASEPQCRGGCCCAPRRCSPPSPPACGLPTRITACGRSPAAAPRRFDCGRTGWRTPPNPGRDRRSRLRFVEVPVTIDYSEYSRAKGQRSGTS